MSFTTTWRQTNATNKRHLTDSTTIRTALLKPYLDMLTPQFNVLFLPLVSKWPHNKRSVVSRTVSAFSDRYFIAVRQQSDNKTVKTDHRCGHYWDKQVRFTMQAGRNWDPIYHASKKDNCKDKSYIGAMRGGYRLQLAVSVSRISIDEWGIEFLMYLNSKFKLTTSDWKLEHKSGSFLLS